MKLVVLSAKSDIKLRTPLSEKALFGYAGLSVVSLRHPEEAKRIKENNGLVVWVDADPRRRYERIASSARGRIDDQKTFDEFIEEEAADMYPGDDRDPARANMGAVQEISDIQIFNNFDLESDHVDYISRTFQL